MQTPTDKSDQGKEPAAVESEKNEPVGITATAITPIDIPLTQPVGQPTAPDLQWHQKPKVWGALALTLLLALAVIFVLPRLVAPPDTAPAVIQLTPPPPEEMPFQDAQLNKARRQSQDILNQLLEKQQFLEKKNVRLWAAKTFENALEQAAEGDLSYRNRQFSEAQQSYAEALQKLSYLEQQLEPLIASNLASANTALENDDAENALNSFALVLAIDSNNRNAIEGKARAEKLNQVLALIEEAKIHQQSGELQRAQQTYQEALALDSKHSGARLGLAKVNQTIATHAFNEAMSRGYSALENGNYSSAKTAFVRALEIRPDDSAAKAALEQTSNQSTQQQVRSLLDQASEYENREQWQRATETYQQLLTIDNSLVSAKVGQLRSNTRAGLDSQIQKILDDPMRLATEKVYQHGRQLLLDARGINNPGPRLQQQITALDEVLTAARSAVTVTFLSDGKTSVTLLKKGSLGQFSSKQLSLTPGNYVATGRRSGYRDERIAFQVTNAGLPSPISIVCREPL